MPPKPLPELLADLRAEPNEGVLRNVLSDLKEHRIVPLREMAERIEPRLAEGPREEAARRGYVAPFVNEVLDELTSQVEGGAPLAAAARRLFGFGRRSQSKKFGSCVKAVRKTVKVRKGSTAEGAAIAICTKSMLFPRGRTLKRYRKGRLYTQKRK